MYLTPITPSNTATTVLLVITSNPIPSIAQPSNHIYNLVNPNPFRYYPRKQSHTNPYLLRNLQKTGNAFGGNESMYIQKTSNVSINSKPKTLTPFAGSTQQHAETKKKQLECKLCSKSFTRKSHLTTHSRIHSKEKPYKCTICSKTFTQKHRYNNPLTYSIMYYQSNTD